MDTLDINHPLPQRAARSAASQLDIVPYEKRLGANSRWALSEASEFFEGRGAVQQALRKITTRTGREDRIPDHRQFFGDGKPKPLSFPEPLSARSEINGVRYLNLEPLIELKLASGMTNAGRLRDLADVIELIKVAGLPVGFAERLNPYFRERFNELWQSAQAAIPDEAEVWPDEPESEEGDGPKTRSRTREHVSHPAVPAQILGTPQSLREFSKKKIE